MTAHAVAAAVVVAGTVVASTPVAATSELVEAAEHVAVALVDSGGRVLLWSLLPHFFSCCCSLACFFFFFRVNSLFLLGHPVREKRLQMFSPPHYISPLTIAVGRLIELLCPDCFFWCSCCSWC